MKTFLSLFVITLFSFGLVANEAEAKRFGGGGNIGKQRSAPIQREAPKQTQNAAPAQAPAQPKQSFMGRWGGMLAGLGIGALIGSMIGGNLGAALGMILNLLLIIGVIYLVYRLFFARKAAPGMHKMQYAGAAPVNEVAPRPAYQGGTLVNDSVRATTSTTDIPADFDAKAFLRQAELAFMRLQAANDAGDLNDIREYTTPEMFAEIAMQIRERGDQAQQTEVVSVNAQLLEVVREGDYTIASVRYTGLIRENRDAAPEAFDEIWHVRRDENDRDGTWLISGIQQVS